MFFCCLVVVVWCRNRIRHNSRWFRLSLFSVVVWCRNRIRHNKQVVNQYQFQVVVWCRNGKDFRGGIGYTTLIYKHIDFHTRKARKIICWYKTTYTSCPRKYGMLFYFRNAAFIAHFGNKMNSPQSMLHKMYLHFL